MRCKQCKREIAEGSTFCNWCGKKQVTDKQLGEIAIPEPRQLSSGKWFIQLRINGESVSVTEDDEKVCKAKARALKKGLLEIKKMPVEITLSGAIDNYIESRSNTLSPSTIRGYRIIQKNRFQSVMDKKLKDISDWQKICNAEAKKCSAKTLRNSYRFIVSVLTENDIQPPKITLPQVVPNERPWLEPEQVNVFVDAIKENECEIPALLALHSLRRSEICALTWDNIDLKKKQILVKGAVVPNEKHQFVRKETNKNETSVRTVPIMIPELTDALKRIEDKSGLIVDCIPNTICNQINRICKANDLPPVGVHGLRHSFASLGYHLGMTEKEVMEIGGWADAQTMRKIYTHLARSDKEKAVNKMSEFYNNANKLANE